MIWAQPTATGSKALMARTRWPWPARPAEPGRGRVRLHQHGQVLAPPEAEGPGRRRVEGEAGRRDGGRRILAGPQQAGQELADDLRLGVAAHGPDQVRQRAVGRR